MTKTEKEIKPEEILVKFAEMSEKSRAFDGDRQEDGWGIIWLDSEKNWRSVKSVKPIWEDMELLSKIPSTKLFVIHARSSSFPGHKNNIEFNQPFTDDNYAFVFNGLLKGVNLTLPGSIGSQKIWSLVQDELKQKEPLEALKIVKEALSVNSREIQALNIGIAGKENIYALCFYSKHPDYYSLRYLDSPDHKMICSEKLSGYDWTSLEADQTVALQFTDKFSNIR
ncbi:TPA: hypothetical protein HA242_06975 [Candidatus Woesearchaeota archaeon]|nr:hypothetical protein [Candidatus Woesearchaeota archaeon]